MQGPCPLSTFSVGKPREHIADMRDPKKLKRAIKPQKSFLSAKRWVYPPISEEQRRAAKARTEESFKQLAAKARSNGDIFFSSLVGLLARDNQYISELPRLLEEFPCESPSGFPREIDFTNADWRFRVWAHLLETVTSDDSSALVRKGIPPLPLEEIFFLHSGEVKRCLVDLNTLAKYFTDVFHIPLPALLFPSEDYRDRSRPGMTSANAKGRNVSSIVQYALLKTGPTWKLVFDSKETSGLRQKGWRYVQYLVERSHRSFTVWDISKDVDEIDPMQIGMTSECANEFVASETGRTKTGEMRSDNHYIMRLREEYEFCISEAIRARSGNDYDRAMLYESKAEQSLQALKKYLDEAKNRGTRTSLEKVRDRITQSINRALRELEKYDKKAFRHFKSAFGTIYSNNLSYDPPESIIWLTH